MAQLGNGLGTGFPDTIDTHQTWVNAPVAAPDSNSRVDAEFLNDTVRAIVAIEQTLGANPQGIFGSVVARLNQFIGGGGGAPGILTFTNVLSLTIPGAVHNVGQGAFLFKIYDANTPAQVMEPGSYTLAVDDATFDIVLSFTTATSGYLAIGATSPLYIRTFTSATTVTILGSAHLLGTSDLAFQVYDSQDPAHAIQPGGLSVHPTTHDVVLTFSSATSGFIILSAGGPTYATSFTSVPTVIIPGNTHQLGTRALLFNVYDAGTPRVAMADPITTVDPTTHDVVFSFGTPLSGRIVLMPATTLTGRDFDIRDAGIINQSAVRLTSHAGVLHLQAGAQNLILIQDKSGTENLQVDFSAPALSTISTALRTLQLRGANFQLWDGGLIGFNACGVSSNSGVLILQSGGGGRIQYRDATGAVGLTMFPDTARLGLGVEPTFQLQLSTDSAAKPGSATWQVLSDIALKEGIQGFTDGLDVLLQLDPVRFHYNGLGGTSNDGREHISLIAQAAQAAAPYLANAYEGQLRPGEAPQSLLTLDPSPLIYLLIKAVKTLHADAEAVRREQATLTDALHRLTARVAALEPPAQAEARP
jgi:hypothetical protein